MQKAASTGTAWSAELDGYRGGCQPRCGRGRDRGLTFAHLPDRIKGEITTPHATDIQHIHPPGHGIGLPFSPVVATGDLVFCSGQVGFLPGTSQLVEGGIQAQTRQAMENLAALLEAAESSLDRVVKTLAFLADAADFAAFNATYASFFPAQFPARSAVQTGFMAPGILVEIECIAVRSPAGG